MHTGSHSSSQPSQPPLSFWFAGDTGYCDVFKEIGRRLGPFDLAAIPTGAYDPRWFMALQHTDAEEGLQVHRDVGARRSIAIHCATFCLTEEPLDEPQTWVGQCWLFALPCGLLAYCAGLFRVVVGAVYGCVPAHTALCN